MPRFDPFSRVNCKYGAPMGRDSDAPANFTDGQKLYARHQGGIEGYDKGCAYWGFPQNVYAVWTRGGEACMYIRAYSKADAIRRVSQGLDSL